MKNLLSKINLNLIIIALLFLFSTTIVNASGTTGQYGQYGGQPEKGRVMVDKLVRDPKTGEYVDNLGLNDAKYSAEATVFFKITVENVGGTTLKTITAVDYLPLYLQYVSGGTYDAANREVHFTFNDVEPGERQTALLQAKVYSLSQLPAEKTVLCPINKVIASSPEDGSDEDTAQLCIQKKPMVSKEAPKAGDPLGLAMGLGSLLTFVGGLKLKKSA